MSQHCQCTETGDEKRGKGRSGEGKGGVGKRGEGCGGEGRRGALKAWSICPQTETGIRDFCDSSWTNSKDQIITKHALL